MVLIDLKNLPSNRQVDLSKLPSRQTEKPTSQRLFEQADVASAKAGQAFRSGDILTGAKETAKDMFRMMGGQLAFGEEKVVDPVVENVAMPAVKFIAKYNPVSGAERAVQEFREGDIAGGLKQVGLGVAGSPLQGVLESTGLISDEDTVKQAKRVSENIMGVPGAKQALQTIGDTYTAINNWKKTLTPEQRADFDAAFQLANAALTTVGFAKASTATTKKILKEAAEGVGEKVTKAKKIGDTIAKGEAFAAKRNEMAEGMLNSMVKVDPKRGAENFFKTSGFAGGKKQTIGKFLLERDIIGSPEEVIDKLLDRFSKSKKRFDAAISSIEGKYKFPAAADAIDDLQKRFIKTKDKGLSKINKLADKYKGEGLTMDEYLDLKRTYEKKVKTGYLKDNNSELIDRATNIDSALRDDFIKEAEKSGFKNIKELSREVQLTKLAMDAIESKQIRRLVNNQFSLTDNLLLMGAAIEPGALSLLGLKKISSLPKIQSKIINALVTNSAKIMKDIPLIPKSIINEKNALKRSQQFQDWLQSTGLKKIIAGKEKKMLPAGSFLPSKSASPSTLLDIRGAKLRGN